MEVLVPECQLLSVEGIRKVLCDLSSKLEEVTRRQNSLDLQVVEELKSRPTLTEFMQGFKNNSDKVQFTLSLDSFKKIVKGFESSVQINLNKFEETSEKYEKIIAKLIQNANLSLNISHLKYKKSQENSKKNERMILDHLLQLHKLNKKRRILEAWNKISLNRKESARRLILLNITHNSKVKSRSFSRWHRLTSKINMKNLSINSQSFQKTLKECMDDVELLKNEVIGLHESKADQDKVRNLEELALKADVRVMFQDIKSIIKTHTDSLKNKYEEEIKAINQEIRFAKENIAVKADSRHLKEQLDTFIRFKADFLDLCKSHSGLVGRINGIDGIMQKENTDFKIGILERKISVVEQRLMKIVEDKGGAVALSTTVCNFPQTKRPVSSVNRSTFHSRKNSSSYV